MSLLAGLWLSLVAGASGRVHFPHCADVNEHSSHAHSFPAHAASAHDHSADAHQEARAAGHAHHGHAESAAGAHGSAPEPPKHLEQEAHIEHPEHEECIAACVLACALGASQPPLTPSPLLIATSDGTALPLSPVDPLLPPALAPPYRPPKTTAL